MARLRIPTILLLACVLVLVGAQPTGRKPVRAPGSKTSSSENKLMGNFELNGVKWQVWRDPSQVSAASPKPNLRL